MNLCILTISALFGTLIGLGSFTFNYAEGFSYFSTDPSACANCHIMKPQLDSWQKSSHHTAATCADCHLPHSFIEKYIAKADNGYRHSKAFTFQDFHEPIQLNQRSQDILQQNCVTCHEPIAHNVVANDIKCTHCHAAVGHGDPPSGIGGPEKPNEIERSTH